MELLINERFFSKESFSLLNRLILFSKYVAGRCGMLIKKPVGVHENKKTGKSKINEVLYITGLIFNP
tara:strand:- start:364 stop:564 length:201 start_codon:yes stop_codon:yes gene_type:complete